MLKNRSAIRIVGDEADIPTAVADIVVCTEVFEHLPPEPFDCALSEIARTLRPGGVAIFGVPIETGPPALAKGLFRMARRFGAEDAQAGRVLSAAMGIAPKREARPVGTDQRPFYYAHLGFDHRDFAQRLAKTYHVQHTHFSPAGSLGAWFNSEVYYIARPER